LFHADCGRRVGAESRLCQKVAVQAQGQSESFSIFFSTGDNFSLAAGKQAHIGGADRFTKTHSNGETLYYNRTTNTFAVKTADGVPKTMFKPDPADYGCKSNLD